MPSRIDWWEVFEVFVWALDKLTRPSFGNLMSSFEEDVYRTYGPRYFRDLEKAKLVQRHHRGKEVHFVVSDKWSESSRPSDHPARHWDKPWKGHWHLLTFDIPVSRHRDRMVLWRQLSDRNIGNLQQSVWIWPHDLRPSLAEILKATGIPECFAAFVAHDLYLCTQQEVVASSWDFEAIHSAQCSYVELVRKLQQEVSRPISFNRLAEIGRLEWRSYHGAMERDPLLPRKLWPVDYLGEKTFTHHRKFRTEFGKQLREAINTQ